MHRGLLTRGQWGATAPLGPRMTLPARGVYVHHSVTAFDDDGDHRSTLDVARDMRDIEAIGRQRFGIFPYSYAIHPTAWLAEGAGDTRGAHTARRNSLHYGVCFIGNKENERISDAEVELFGRFCQWKVRAGLLVPDFFMDPHRAVKATACPGRNVIARWDDLVDAARDPNLGSVEAGDDDDMTDEESRKLNAVYALITWGFVTPTTDSGHPDLSKPAFGPTGELTHHLRRINKNVKDIEAKVEALEAAGATGGLSDADVRKIVDAVIAEIAS